MKRRTRGRTLCFEGLETRLLLAADLFQVRLEDPIVDVCCLTSYQAMLAEDASSPAINWASVSDAGASDAGAATVYTVISEADLGTRQDTVISDLAFAELGAEANSRNQPDV